MGSIPAQAGVFARAGVWVCEWTVCVSCDGLVTGEPLNTPPLLDIRISNSQKTESGIWRHFLKHLLWFPKLQFDIFLVRSVASSSSLQQRHTTREAELNQHLNTIPAAHSHHDTINQSADVWHRHGGVSWARDTLLLSEWSIQHPSHGLLLGQRLWAAAAVESGKLYKMAGYFLLELMSERDTEPVRHTVDYITTSASPRMILIASISCRFLLTSLIVLTENSNSMAPVWRLIKIDLGIQSAEPC